MRHGRRGSMTIGSQCPGAGRDRLVALDGTGGAAPRVSGMPPRPARADDGDHGGTLMSGPAQNAELTGADFGDRADFTNADRGFIGALDPMVVKAADGRVVWEMESWRELTRGGPGTVAPGLGGRAPPTAQSGRVG